MLRRRVRQNGESGDALEQLFRAVTPPELADGGANAAFVALQKRFVEVYFRPFFLTGGLAFARAGADAVAVMPSDSERLSSTSTVCVMVSLTSGAGLAAAGAMVCVVGCGGAPLLCREQLALRNAASIRMKIGFT